MPKKLEAKYSAWEALRVIQGELSPELHLKRVRNEKRTSKISFFEVSSNGRWFALIGDPEGSPTSKERKQTRLLFETMPPKMDGVRPEDRPWKGGAIKRTRLQKHSSVYVESAHALRKLLEWYVNEPSGASNLSETPAITTGNAAVSYSYAETSPVITRIIEDAGGDNFVGRDEIVDALLKDAEGSALIALARSGHSYPNDRMVASDMVALFSKFSYKVADWIERTELDGKIAYRAKRDRVAEDIKELVADEKLTPTERQQMILARIGQGKFRRNVILVWNIGERCVVTGNEIRQVLIASHIVPWSEDESIRLDGANGLLLCAHLDRLFDAHLVSFDDSGEIIFSTRLSESNMQSLLQLGVEKTARLETDGLSATSKRRVLENLGVHRKELQLKDEASL